MARDAKVNIDDKKWGTMLPGDAHQSASGGGIHSNSYIDDSGKLVPKGKLENGKNRNWNNEWNEWADNWKGNNAPGAVPTEAEFSAQYNKMRNESYYKEAFSRGTAAAADYGKVATTTAEVAKGEAVVGDAASLASKAGGVVKMGSKVLGPLAVGLTLGTSAAEAKEGLAEGKNPSDVERTMYYRNVSLTGQTPEEMETSKRNASQSFFNWMTGSGWKTDAEVQQQQNQNK